MKCNDKTKYYILCIADFILSILFHFPIMVPIILSVLLTTFITLLSQSITWYFEISFCTFIFLVIYVIFTDWNIYAFFKTKLTEVIQKRKDFQEIQEEHKKEKYQETRNILFDKYYYNNKEQDNKLLDVNFALQQEEEKEINRNWGFEIFTALITFIIFLALYDILGQQLQKCTEDNFTKDHFGEIMGTVLFIALFLPKFSKIKQTKEDIAKVRILEEIKDKIKSEM